MIDINQAKRKNMPSSDYKHTDKQERKRNDRIQKHTDVRIQA